jgi:hypothetical protein
LPLSLTTGKAAIWASTMRGLCGWASCFFAVAFDGEARLSDLDEDSAVTWRNRYHLVATLMGIELEVVGVEFGFIG